MVGKGRYSAAQLRLCLWVRQLVYIGSFLISLLLLHVSLEALTPQAVRAHADERQASVVSLARSYHPLTFGLDDLEVAVWASEDSFLPELERQIVRRIQTQPKSVYAYYLLSHVYIRMFALDPQRLDLLQKSSELAEHCLQLQPTEEYGYMAVAHILDMMGKAEQGLQLLNSDHGTLVKSSWRYYFTKARLSMGENSITEVLSLLKKSLQAEASKPAIIIPYVIAMLMTQYEKWDLENHIHNWQQEFPHPYFDLIRAINLSSMQEFAKAHNTYRSILKRFPDHTEAAINDAALLYQHLKQPVLAKETLLSLLPSTPKLKGAENTTEAAVYAHLGAIELQMHKPKPASDYFLKSLTLSRPNPGPTLEFIVTTYRLGKHWQALTELLRQVIERLPGQAQLYALLADIHAQELKQYHIAARFYENATLLAPEVGAYFIALGLNHYHLKNYHQALTAFDQAISLDPEDAIALYNKACVLALSHETEASLSYLQKAVNLEPSLQEKAITDEDFKNIRELEGFKKTVTNAPLEILD